MFSVIGLLKKPEGQSTEEWREWWRGKHVPHVLQIPGLRHYVIYPIDEVRTSVVPNEYGTDVPYDGVAIITFDSRQAYHDAIETKAGNDDKMHLRTGTSDVTVLFGNMEEQLPWSK